MTISLSCLRENERERERERRQGREILERGKTFKSKDIS